MRLKEKTHNSSICNYTLKDLASVDSLFFSIQMVSAQQTKQWNGDHASFSVCWQHAFYGCLCLNRPSFAFWRMVSLWKWLALPQWSKPEIFHINPRASAKLGTFPEHNVVLFKMLRETFILTRDLTFVWGSLSLQ